MAEHQSLGDRLSQFSWKEWAGILVFLCTIAMQTGALVARQEAIREDVRRVLAAQSASQSTREEMREELARLEARVGRNERDLSKLIDETSEHVHRGEE